MRAHCGFTLPEVLTAGAVATIVIGFAVSVFVSAQVMLHDTVRETTLALAGAELREKLLHRLLPSSGGEFSAGLNSATNSGAMVEGGANPNVVAHCFVYDAASGREGKPADVRLMLADDDGTRYLLNERMPDRDRHAHYLRPAGARLAAGSIADVVECGSGGDDGQLVLRCPLALGSSRRVEVVRVSLFGCAQQPPEGL